MPLQEQQARLEEAFDRIEETILPCIAMMLDTLLDASKGIAETDPKALAAGLQILAAELEELTRIYQGRQSYVSFLYRNMSMHAKIYRGIIHDSEPDSLNAPLDDGDDS